MKKTHFIILFLITSTSFFCGCSSETVTKDIAKKEKSTLKKERKAKAMEVPSLDSLFVLSEHTMYVIDKVNDSKDKNIQITGENIIIEGWAIDKRAENVPAGVYITVGKKVFTAVSGMIKPSVAIAYDNKDLLRSGFSAVIPIKNIPKGKQPLEIHVITTDMKSAYPPNLNQLINLIIE